MPRNPRPPASPEYQAALDAKRHGEPLPSPDNIDATRLYPRLLASQILGRSPQTIDRWCKAGVLDVRHIGVRAKGITGASIRRVLAGESVEAA